MTPWPFPKPGPQALGTPHTPDFGPTDISILPKIKLILSTHMRTILFNDRTQGHSTTELQPQTFLFF